jgi:hypothetical protein
MTRLCIMHDMTRLGSMHLVTPLGIMHFMAFFATTSESDRRPHENGCDQCRE